MNFPPETVDVFRLGQEGISREVLPFLIVALNKRYVMDSPGFSMNIYDNGWPITTSTAGRLMLSDDLRGVSKHNAGAVVISQDRSDLSGEPRSAYGASAKLTGMASLFPVRMVFRQPRSMVERALRWLGVDPTSERVEQVMNLPVGHCLLRDQESRVGK